MNSPASLGYFTIILLSSCLRFPSLASTATGFVTTDPSVLTTTEPDGSVRFSSEWHHEYVIESGETVPVKSAQLLRIAAKVRTIVLRDFGSNYPSRVLPELACFDPRGNDLSPALPLGTRGFNSPFGDTGLIEVSRIIRVRPGTESVRARLRASGQVVVAALTLERLVEPGDSYREDPIVLGRAALRGAVHPAGARVGNAGVVAAADQDGDGKWALLQRGAGPTVNEETVLKSDTTLQDRTPDRTRAVQLRLPVGYPGRFKVMLADPGRSVAISIDGERWSRHEGGGAIHLPGIPSRDGHLELWIDNCFADPYYPGPVYLRTCYVVGDYDDENVARLMEQSRTWRQDRPATSLATRREFAVQVAAARSDIAARLPIRCGVPLPRGELADAAHAAIFRADGRQLPTQNQTMARWPDGSVRWLLLEFVDDFSAAPDPRADRDDAPGPQAIVGYTVAYGTAVRALPPAERVVVVRTSNGLEVTNGVLTFSVSRRHFGLMENVRLANGTSLQDRPAQVLIRDESGVVRSSLDQPLARLEIEREGPLHTVILAETKLPVSGRPSHAFLHRARIHVHAGSPLVEVELFVANTTSQSPTRRRSQVRLGETPLDVNIPHEYSYERIQALDLVVQRSAPTAHVSHSLLPTVPSAIGAIVQQNEKEARIVVGEDYVRTWARVRGWLLAEAEDATTIGLGVADFADRFPKALRWNRDELRVSLWAAEGGVYEWMSGVGNAHRITFFYGAGRPRDGRTLGEHPALAVASPEWYCASGVFGPQIPIARSSLPELDRRITAAIEGSAVARQERGFEDFGDWLAPLVYVRRPTFSGRYTAGGAQDSEFRMFANNEYDAVGACLLHFFRSGDRRVLKAGLAGAEHAIFVDHIYYSHAYPGDVGMQRVHSHRHFGHHVGDRPDKFHVGFVQGMIWHSYLTGDMAGIRAAAEIADWATALLQPLSPHRRKRAEPEEFTWLQRRIIGNALVTLMATYEATENETYLRMASQLVDWLFKWESREGGGLPAHDNVRMGMFGRWSRIIHAGAIAYNEWVGSPELDQMLERFARSLLASGSAEVGGEGRLLSHVYQSTRDPVFLSVRREFENLQVEDSIRGIGINLSQAPWFIGALAHAAESSTNQPPPPNVPTPNPPVQSAPAPASPHGSLQVAASTWEQRTHGGVGDYPPENTRDGIVSAKSSWRAEGEGAWIQFDLGQPMSVEAVDLAFLFGHTRRYHFDLSVSETGADDAWATILSRTTSSGTTSGLERFTFPPQKARFVRLTGRGNTSEKFPTWFNLTEVAVVAK